MSDVTPEFIEAISRETGVPSWLLAEGDTPLAVWDIAEHATAWKNATAAQAPTPTAAVPASVPYEPITPQGCVPDGDYLTAWRTGKLAPAGIPAPRPRAPRDRRGMPW